MYYLILANGHTIEFHVLSCAEIFQKAWGGRIVHSDHYLEAA